VWLRVTSQLLIKVLLILLCPPWVELNLGVLPIEDFSDPLYLWASSSWSELETHRGDFGSGSTVWSPPTVDYRISIFFYLHLRMSWGKPLESIYRRSLVKGHSYANDWGQSDGRGRRWTPWRDLMPLWCHGLLFWAHWPHVGPLYLIRSISKFWSVLFDLSFLESRSSLKVQSTNIRFFCQT
jgi:hypothetical protein